MNGFLARRFAARAGYARLSLSVFLLALSIFAAIPVAWADGFSFGPLLATRRESHSATLLPSGKVLVVGGYNTLGNLASTELYDPNTGTWSAGASLATARDQQTATLLPSGEVLVVGGRASDGQSALSSTELYDPTSGTWHPAAAMSDARYGHTATLLPSGKVLVTGGFTPYVSLASAEIYDPLSDTWSPAAALSTARVSSAATLLASGKVLISGGSIGASYLSSSEIYDEASDTWTPAAPLSESRATHTSTLLPSGDVLVAGGTSNSGMRTNAELYDPDADVWTPAGTLSMARYLHTATLLPSGNVLVAGGYYGSAAHEDLYIASSNSWVSTGGLIISRNAHTATLLSSGKVLIAGGYNGAPLQFTEFYDPASTTQTTVVSTAPATTVVGQNYDVGFTVTSAVGAPPGSVIVSDDTGASCGPVILSNGAGSCSLVSTSAGQRTVTASYVPDDSASFAASSGTATQEVDKADTTLQILSADPDPSLPGQAVTVTVAFAVVAPGSGTPSVPIVAGAGADYCDIPQGSTSCTVTLNTAGIRSLVASFQGDDNFNGAYATTEHIVNTPPVAGDDHYSLDEDMSLSVSAQDGVLANDSDPDGDALVILNVGPGAVGGIGGQIVLNPDGSFTYVPPANANGTATFEYLISDNAATVTATVSIDVASVNDPPHFALAADPSWPPGASGAKVLPAFAQVTDFGAPDESGQHVQAWLVSKIDDPEGVIVGNAAIAIDGTLSYTLSGHDGIATFEVRLQDDGGTANGGNDTSPQQMFTITAATGADLSIAIDDGTAFAIGGDPLLYMITVRNLGPDNASGAHVFDLLPSNLVDATWTCTPSAGAMCSASGNGGIDDHVDMPSGATLVYELTATVLENPESAVDHVVSVTAPSGVTDVDPANNSATDIDATGIFADSFDDAADEEDGALKDRVRDDSADHRHQK